MAEYDEMTQTWTLDSDEYQYVRENVQYGHDLTLNMSLLIRDALAHPEKAADTLTLLQELVEGQAFGGKSSGIWGVMHNLNTVLPELEDDDSEEDEVSDEPTSSVA